jgi:antitoxin component YwqK of YwqJK toxin-antitoxin module
MRKYLFLLLVFKISNLNAQQSKPVVDTIVVDGKISIIKSELNGELHGDYYFYYENGNLKKKIEFSYGKRNGVYEEYNENGKLSKKGFYAIDEQNGDWYCKLPRS